MLADPQSIKISGTTKSLPRTDVQGSSSTYTSEDGLTTVKLSTTKSRRKRHVVRVDVEKTAADPFVPAQNKVVSMSFYMVIDRPLEGYTNEEALKVAEGLIEMVSASTFSLLKKLLGGES